MLLSYFTSLKRAYFVEIQIIDFTDWRNKSRALLNEGMSPDSIHLIAKNSTGDLFYQHQVNVDLPASVISQVKPITIARDFMQRAHWVSHHNSVEKWQLLYSLAWRLVYEDKRLLYNPIDSQVADFNRMFKAVTRDHHKMKAFVRFRSIADFTGEVAVFQSPELLEPEVIHNQSRKKSQHVNKQASRGIPKELAVKKLIHKVSKSELSTQVVSGKDEHFIAWFEPEHSIVPLASSFFVKRFSSMSWSLLTPYECVHWHDQRLVFTEGVPRPPLPEDQTEALWLQYYSSIFNPARVKVKAMQSEMPKKYWKNLPEAQLIQTLLQRATVRVDNMFENSKK